MNKPELKKSLIILKKEIVKASPFNIREGSLIKIKMPQTWVIFRVRRFTCQQVFPSSSHIFSFHYVVSLYLTKRAKCYVKNSTQ